MLGAVIAFSARRTYANDSMCRHARRVFARHTEFGDRGCTRFSGADGLAGLSICERRSTDHDVGHLQISDVWRAAALPAGIALMIVFAMLRLTRAVRTGDVFINRRSCRRDRAVLAGHSAVSSLGEFLNLLIFFVGVVAATVFAGVPIAFAFGLAIFGYLALDSFHTPLSVLVGRMDEGMSHLILLAVPLFVFLGLLIEMTGMARGVGWLFAHLVGHVRGGLHFVLVAGMYLVSEFPGRKPRIWRQWRLCFFRK